ncbi:MAG: hypothetical protein NC086_10845 [Alistipes sp.]|nr:hypothetical protein [Alistipes sp.]
MKRINKKMLVSAAIFSAAVNMNACAYGPPEDQLVRMSYIQKAEVQTEKSETENMQIPEDDIMISNVRYSD